MKKEMGDKIRIQRLSMGLSQDNMAFELGISVGAYSNIERGITNLTIVRLYKIADILKMDVLYFLPNIKVSHEPERPDYPDPRVVKEIMAELEQLKKEISEIKGESKEYPTLRLNRKKKG